MKRILLIVTGGIAAYKTPDLVRRLRERQFDVRCIVTRAGREFVSPLALAAVSGQKVHEALFDLTDEAEMGHIELSRSADVVLVAPATANIMAKAAHGLADDLASTALMATDKPVVMAPAMNVRMWEHAATQANLKTLTARGITFIGPEKGDMACGEFGYGRMSAPLDIAEFMENWFQGDKPLSGKHAIVTSGPTHEPIDPVRYIANRSSGKQGHAIAKALAQQGCRVTLISGPTHQPTPAGVDVVKVETAQDMLKACEAALPSDIAVFCAAVADWRVEKEADQKLKKQDGKALPNLSLAENPDILATISKKKKKRPGLVIGFAAETEMVVENAIVKRKKKGCDWIVANDVSQETGTFGGDENRVNLIRGSEVENWPKLDKVAVAERLVAEIIKDVREGKK